MPVNAPEVISKIWDDFYDPLNKAYVSEIGESALTKFFESIDEYVGKCIKKSYDSLEAEHEKRMQSMTKKRDSLADELDTEKKKIDKAHAETQASLARELAALNEAIPKPSDPESKRTQYTKNVQAIQARRIAETTKIAQEKTVIEKSSQFQEKKRALEQEESEWRAEYSKRRGAIDSASNQLMTKLNEWKFNYRKALLEKIQAYKEKVVGALSPVLDNAPWPLLAVPAEATSPSAKADKPLPPGQPPVESPPLPQAQEERGKSGAAPAQPSSPLPLATPTPGFEGVQHFVTQHPWAGDSVAFITHCFNQPLIASKAFEAFKSFIGSCTNGSAPLFSYSDVTEFAKAVEQKQDNLTPLFDIEKRLTAPAAQLPFNLPKTFEAKETLETLVQTFPFRDLPSLYQEKIYEGLGGMIPRFTAVNLLNPIQTPDVFRCLCDEESVKPKSESPTVLPLHLDELDPLKHAKLTGIILNINKEDRAAKCPLWIMLYKHQHKWTAFIPAQTLSEAEIERLSEEEKAKLIEGKRSQLTEENIGHINEAFHRAFGAEETLQWHPVSMTAHSLHGHNDLRDVPDAPSEDVGHDLRFPYLMPNQGYVAWHTVLFGRVLPFCLTKRPLQEIERYRHTLPLTMLLEETYARTLHVTEIQKPEIPPDLLGTGMMAAIIAKALNAAIEIGPASITLHGREIVIKHQMNANELIRYGLANRAFQDRAIRSLQDVYQEMTQMGQCGKDTSLTKAAIPDIFNFERYVLEREAKTPDPLEARKQVLTWIRSRKDFLAEIDQQKIQIVVPDARDQCALVVGEKLSDHTLYQLLLLIYHYGFSRLVSKDPGSPLTLTGLGEVESVLLSRLLSFDPHLKTISWVNAASADLLKEAACCAARNRFLARSGIVFQLDVPMYDRRRLWDTVGQSVVALFQSGAKYDLDFSEKVQAFYQGVLPQKGWFEKGCPELSVEEEALPENDFIRGLDVLKFAQIAQMGLKVIPKIFTALQDVFWKDTNKAGNLSLACTFDLNCQTCLPKDYLQAVNLYLSLFYRERLLQSYPRSRAPFFSALQFVMPRSWDAACDNTLIDIFRSSNDHRQNFDKACDEIRLYGMDLSDRANMQRFLGALLVYATKSGAFILPVIPALDRLVRLEETRGLDASATNKDYCKIKALYREVQNKILDNRRRQHGLTLEQKTYSLENARFRNQKERLDDIVTQQKQEEDLLFLDPEDEDDENPTYIVGGLSLGMQQQQQQQQQQQAEQQQQQEQQKEQEREQARQINYDLYRGDRRDLLSRDTIGRDFGSQQSWDKISPDIKAVSGVAPEAQAPLSALFSQWVGSQQDAKHVIRFIERKAVEKLMQYAGQFRLGIAKDNLPPGFYLESHEDPALKDKNGSLVLRFTEEREKADLQQMTGDRSLLAYTDISDCVQVPQVRRRDNPFKVMFHKPWKAAVMPGGDDRQFNVFNLSQRDFSYKNLQTFWRYLAHLSVDPVHEALARQALGSQVNDATETPEVLARIQAETQSVGDQPRGTCTPETCEACIQYLQAWAAQVPLLGDKSDKKSAERLIECLFLKALPDRFSPDERPLSLKEQGRTLKAFGQVMQHYDAIGARSTQSGSQKLLQIAYELKKAFGDKALFIWRDRLLAPSENWCETLQQDEVDAVVLSTTLLQTKNPPGQDYQHNHYQALWWRIVDKHGQSTGHMRYAPLWAAYQKVLTWMDKKVTITPEILAAFDRYAANEPDFHGQVFLDRLFYALEYAYHTSDPKATRQAILENLDKIDWRHNGFYYGIAYEPMPMYWHEALEEKEFTAASLDRNRSYVPLLDIPASSYRQSRDLQPAVLRHLACRLPRDRERFDQIQKLMAPWWPSEAQGAQRLDNVYVAQTRILAASVLNERYPQQDFTPAHFASWKGCNTPVSGKWICWASEAILLDLKEPPHWPVRFTLMPVLIEALGEMSREMGYLEHLTPDKRLKFLSAAGAALNYGAHISKPPQMVKSFFKRWLTAQNDNACLQAFPWLIEDATATGQIDLLWQRLDPATKARLTTQMQSIDFQESRYLPSVSDIEGVIKAINACDQQNPQPRTSYSYGVKTEIPPTEREIANFRDPKRSEARQAFVVAAINKGCHILDHGGAYRGLTLEEKNYGLNRIKERLAQWPFFEENKCLCEQLLSRLAVEATRSPKEVQNAIDRFVGLLDKINNKRYHNDLGQLLGVLNEAAFKQNAFYSLNQLQDWVSTLQRITARQQHYPVHILREVVESDSKGFGLLNTSLNKLKSQFPSDFHSIVNVVSARLPAPYEALLVRLKMTSSVSSNLFSSASQFFQANNPYQDTSRANERDRQQVLFDKCSPEHVQAVYSYLEEVARPQASPAQRGPRDDDFWLAVCSAGPQQYNLRCPPPPLPPNQNIFWGLQQEEPKDVKEPIDRILRELLEETSATLAAHLRTACLKSNNAASAPEEARAYQASLEALKAVYQDSWKGWSRSYVPNKTQACIQIIITQATRDETRIPQHFNAEQVRALKEKLCQCTVQELITLAAYYADGVGPSAEMLIEHLRMEKYRQEAAPQVVDRYSSDDQTLSESMLAFCHHYETVLQATDFKNNNKSKRTYSTEPEERQELLRVLSGFEKKGKEACGVEAQLDLMHLFYYMNEYSVMQGLEHMKRETLAAALSDANVAVYQAEEKQRRAEAEWKLFEEAYANIPTFYKEIQKKRAEIESTKLSLKEAETIHGVCDKTRALEGKIEQLSKDLKPLEAALSAVCEKTPEVIRKGVSAELRPIEKDVFEKIQREHQATLAAFQTEAKRASARVLACMRETLLRKTGKWANHTQMLALLYAASHNDESFVHQIRTGEGKSIISIMRTAYLALRGNTVDVFSAKESLSSRDFEEARPVLRAMGIPCGYIKPNSQTKDYKVAEKPKKGKAGEFFRRGQGKALGERPIPSEDAATLVVTDLGYLNRDKTGKLLDQKAPFSDVSFAKPLMGAVNYATIGNFSLFLEGNTWDPDCRDKIELDPSRRVAFIDELDHVLVDETTQFNLTKKDKKSFYYNFDTWAYQVVYQWLEANEAKLEKDEAGQLKVDRRPHLEALCKLLKEAKKLAPSESELFSRFIAIPHALRPPKKSESETIEQREKRKQVLERFKKRRDDRLVRFLKAAQAAKSLKEGDANGFTVRKEPRRVQDNVIDTRVAKVVIAKQVQAGSTYSELVQQFLHVRLNNEATQRGETPDFFVEPESNIALSLNAETLLQKHYYRNIEGCTGTAGDKHMQQRYNDKYGITYSLKIPTHAAIKTHFMPTTYCENFEAQISEIVAKIKERAPQQPILMTCKDDSQVKRIYEAIAAQLRAQGIQDITLIEDTNDKGKEESEIVPLAGNIGTVTISARMGRGTDIKPKPAKDGQEHGLFVMRTYPASARVTKQELGRQGRNGKLGRCITLLDYSEIEARIALYQKDPQHRGLFEKFMQEERDHLKKKMAKHAKRRVQKLSWLDEAQEKKDQYLAIRTAVRLQAHIENIAKAPLRHKENMLARMSVQVIDVLRDLPNAVIVDSEADHAALIVDLIRDHAARVEILRETISAEWLTCREDLDHAWAEYLSATKQGSELWGTFLDKSRTAWETFVKVFEAFDVLRGKINTKAVFKEPLEDSTEAVFKEPLEDSLVEPQEKHFVEMPAQQKAVMEFIQTWVKYSTLEYQPLSKQNNATQESIDAQKQALRAHFRETWVFEGDFEKMKAEDLKQLNSRRQMLSMPVLLGTYQDPYKHLDTFFDEMRQLGAEALFSEKKKEEGNSSVRHPERSEGSPADISEFFQGVSDALLRLRETTQVDGKPHVSVMFKLPLMQLNAYVQSWKDYYISLKKSEYTPEQINSAFDNAILLMSALCDFATFPAERKSEPLKAHEIKKYNALMGFMNKIVLLVGPSLGAEGADPIIEKFLVTVRNVLAAEPYWSRITNPRTLALLASALGAVVSERAVPQNIDLLAKSFINEESVRQLIAMALEEPGKQVLKEGKKVRFLKMKQGMEEEKKEGTATIKILSSTYKMQSLPSHYEVPMSPEVFSIAQERWDPIKWGPIPVGLLTGTTSEVTGPAIEYARKKAHNDTLVEGRSNEFKKRVRAGELGGYDIGEEERTKRLMFLEYLHKLTHDEIPDPNPNESERASKILGAHPIRPEHLPLVPLLVDLTIGDKENATIEALPELDAPFKGARQIDFWRFLSYRKPVTSKELNAIVAFIAPPAQADKAPPMSLLNEVGQQALLSMPPYVSITTIMANIKDLTTPQEVTERLKALAYVSTIFNRWMMLQGYIQFTEEYAPLAEKTKSVATVWQAIFRQLPLAKAQVFFETMYRYQVPGALPEKLVRMMQAEAQQCSEATQAKTVLKLRLVAEIMGLESTQRNRLLSVMPFDAPDFNWEHFALFLKHVPAYFEEANLRGLWQGLSNGTIPPTAEALEKAIDCVCQARKFQDELGESAEQRTEALNALKQKFFGPDIHAEQEERISMMRGLTSGVVSLSNDQDKAFTEAHRQQMRQWALGIFPESPDEENYHDHTTLSLKRLQDVIQEITKISGISDAAAPEEGQAAAAPKVVKPPVVGDQTEAVALIADRYDNQASPKGLFIEQEEAYSQVKWRSFERRRQATALFTALRAARDKTSVSAYYHQVLEVVLEVLNKTRSDLLASNKSKTSRFQDMVSRLWVTVVTDYLTEMTPGLPPLAKRLKTLQQLDHKEPLVAGTAAKKKKPKVSRPQAEVVLTVAVPEVPVEAPLSADEVRRRLGVYRQEGPSALLQELYKNKAGAKHHLETIIHTHFEKMIHEPAAFIRDMDKLNKLPICLPLSYIVKELNRVTHSQMVPSLVPVLNELQKGGERLTQWLRNQGCLDDQGQLKRENERIGQQWIGIFNQMSVGQATLFFEYMEETQLGQAELPDQFYQLIHQAITKQPWDAFYVRGVLKKIRAYLDLSEPDRLRVTNMGVQALQEDWDKLMLFLKIVPERYQLTEDGEAHEFPSETANALWQSLKTGKILSDEWNLSQAVELAKQGLKIEKEAQEALKAREVEEAARKAEEARKAREAPDESEEEEGEADEEETEAKKEPELPPETQPKAAPEPEPVSKEQRERERERTALMQALEKGLFKTSMDEPGTEAVWINYMNDLLETIKQAFNSLIFDDKAPPKLNKQYHKTAMASLKTIAEVMKKVAEVKFNQKVAVVGEDAAIVKETAAQHHKFFTQQEKAYGDAWWKNRDRRKQAKNLFTSLANLEKDDTLTSSQDYCERALNLISKTQCEIVTTDRGSFWRNRKGFSRLQDITVQMFAEVAVSYLKASDKTDPDNIKHRIKHIADLLSTQKGLYQGALEAHERKGRKETKKTGFLGTGNTVASYDAGKTPKVLHPLLDLMKSLQGEEAASEERKKPGSGL